MAERCLRSSPPQTAAAAVVGVANDPSESKPEKSAKRKRLATLTAPPSDGSVRVVPKARNPENRAKDTSDVQAFGRGDRCCVGCTFINSEGAKKCKICRCCLPIVDEVTGTEAFKVSKEREVRPKSKGDGNGSEDDVVCIDHPAAASSSSKGGAKSARTVSDAVSGECLCPITHEVMRDPVVAADGHHRVAQERQHQPD